MTADRPSLSFTQLTAIAEVFANNSQIAEIKSFGTGNINDTFLVSLATAQPAHFVLQRLNTQVFRQPDWVMQNIQTLCRHVCDRISQATLDRRWEVSQVLCTSSGENHWQSADGSFWRAMSYVENSKTYDNLHHQRQAEEVGYALGMFHHLISDLPSDQLKDTLEGFHITPRYLIAYEQTLAVTPVKSSPEVDYCLRFIRDRKDWASVLETAKAQGKLPLRLMHGDPKVNNVLFDRDTDQAIGMIDLDTVKPGLVHYDIGDCLRSGCNPLGEETADWQGVYFDTDLCQGLLKGYLSVANAFLTPNDQVYIFDAIRLITFELGLRFLADYLANNIYFKVAYPHHNLARALVQFQLTASIEAQETQIRQIIHDLT